MVLESKLMNKEACTYNGKTKFLANAGHNINQVHTLPKTGVVSLSKALHLL